MLYVNGIALGVLELKRSTISVFEGIRQNLDNQKSIFIKSFFTTMQFVMAGNDTEGLRYATIETPAKYYLTWKEASNIENPLDRHLLQLCPKERFLELIHDFIVFDVLPKGIKQNKEAVAETIENNLRKVIIDRQPTNPKYFEKMSALLDDLIQARKAAAQDYKAYLQKVVESSKQVTQLSKASEYPQSLNSPAKKALYDNLDRNEELSLAIDDAIRRTKKDGWRGNKIKEREVKNAIKQHLDSPEDCDSIFEIVKSHEY